MSEIIDQMIKALDLEIAAIRKRGGGTRVELYNGRYFETNGTLSADQSAARLRLSRRRRIDRPLQAFPIILDRPAVVKNPGRCAPLATACALHRYAEIG